MMIGKTIQEAQTIKNVDIAHELSLPPVKIHCSVLGKTYAYFHDFTIILAEDAIKAAVWDVKKMSAAE